MVSAEIKHFLAARMEQLERAEKRKVLSDTTLD